MARRWINMPAAVHVLFVQSATATGCSSGRSTNGALPNAMPQAVPCFSFVSASCDGAVNENVQTRNLLEPNCIGRLLSVGYGPALCCSSHSWLTSVCVLTIHIMGLLNWFMLILFPTFCCRNQVEHSIFRGVCPVCPAFFTRSISKVVGLIWQSEHGRLRLYGRCSRNGLPRDQWNWSWFM